jgi:hypothetical protein
VMDWRVVIEERGSDCTSSTAPVNFIPTPFTAPQSRHRICQQHNLLARDVSLIAASAGVRLCDHYYKSQICARDMCHAACVR